MDDNAKELAREVASEVLKSIEPRLQIHFEGVQELMKTLAGGYGGNLDRIERELKDLNVNMDTKLGDHDRVLLNHNERITKLENTAV